MSLENAAYSISTIKEMKKTEVSHFFKLSFFASLSLDLIPERTNKVSNFGHDVSGPVPRMMTDGAISHIIYRGRRR